MQKIREFFGKVRELASKNPKATFIAILTAIVVCIFLIASTLPSPHPSTPTSSGATASTAVQTPPKQEQERQGNVSPISPVINGEVQVHEFSAGEMTKTTLGGVLPPGAGVEIDPEEAESRWGGSWDAASPEKVEPKSATVTWPLGGKYTRLHAKIGFLPGGSDVHHGGVYEVFVDGQRVWSKAVMPDDVAMGRVTDETLDIDLTGKNALTLRITASIYKDTSFGTRYRPTVPYPVVLYDMKLEGAGK